MDPITVSQSLLLQVSPLTWRPADPQRGVASQSLLLQVSPLTKRRRWCFRRPLVSIPSSSGLASNATGAQAFCVYRVSIPSSSGLASNATGAEAFCVYRVSIPSSSGLASNVERELIVHDELDVSIPSSSGLASNRVIAGRDRRLASVSIPSSSGLASNRRRDRDATGLYRLNPFFFRSRL